MQRTLIFVLIGFLMLFTSCATTNSGRMTIGIDSIVNKEYEAKKNVYILSSMQNTSNDDLHFQEYNRYVGKALINKGYSLVDNINDAQLIVFMAYGMGDPKTYTYSYAIPIIGQTGYSNVSTTGSSFKSGNMTISNQNTTYTPSYGVVGAINTQKSVTYYPIWITLEACDRMALTKNKIKYAWQTKIISVDKNNDIRELFPYIIAGAIPYIGTDSKHRVVFEVDFNDPLATGWIYGEGDIGLSVTKGALVDGLMITEIQPGSPAEKADLQLYDDIITEIDGGSPYDYDFRGEPGTNIVLKVFNTKQNTTRNVTLKREVLHTN